jgi:hypothetical protein
VIAHFHGCVWGQAICVRPARLRDVVRGIGPRTLRERRFEIVLAYLALLIGMATFWGVGLGLVVLMAKVPFLAIPASLVGMPLMIGLTLVAGALSLWAPEALAEVAVRCRALRKRTLVVVAYGDRVDGPGCHRTRELSVHHVARLKGTERIAHLLACGGRDSILAAGEESVLSVLEDLLRVAPDEVVQLRHAAARCLMCWEAAVAAYRRGWYAAAIGTLRALGSPAARRLLERAQPSRTFFELRNGSRRVANPVYEDIALALVDIGGPRPAARG